MLKSRSGFSLIELMFVIVVAAFFVLLAASHQQRKGRQTTLEITSIEMQNWLQAAASYFLENEKWPDNATDLTQDNTYIRQEEQCSLWPGEGNESCPSRAIYHLICPGENCDPQKAKYFGVAVDLPDINIASELTTLLPSAEILDTGDGVQVVAYIPIPAAVSNNYVQQDIQQGWIASAGVLRTGSSSCNYPDRIYLPECPSGYEGHYIQMFQKQRTGEATGLKGPLNKCEDSYSAHPFIEFDIDALNLSDENPSVTVKHIFGKDKRQFQYHYYMTFCLPNGQWHADDYYGKGHYENQCSGLWRSYNSGGTLC